MSTMVSPPKLTQTIEVESPVSDRAERKSVWQVIRNVGRRVINHNCTETAGEIAFDFSFSIFPAALSTAALVGLLQITPEFVSQALDVMGIFLHEGLRTMVDSNIKALVEARSQNLLTIGFLGAAWAASSAISGSIKGLNEAYDVQETRSFWYRRSLSIGLMFGVGLSIVIFFILLIMWDWIEGHILIRLGITHYLQSVMAVLNLPIGFLSAVLMSGLLYRVAPNCQPKIHQVIPGAILFTILWFFLSKGFGYYVGNFSYYNRVTGTLGVFIVLQLWIYMTALILLIGGELNAELFPRKSR